MEIEKKKKKCKIAMNQMYQIEYLLDKIGDKLIDLRLYDKTKDAYHKARELLVVEVLGTLEEYDLWGEKEDE